MNLGIGIMAHPSREEQVVTLMQMVQPNSLWVDFDEHGEIWTGDKTWGELARLETEWSIVLQDDAIPVPDFHRWAGLYLENAPQTAVSFYVGTCRPRFTHVLDAVERAERGHTSWLEADTLLWGVGVAMPTAHIERFLEWGKTAPAHPYDTRIGEFYRREMQQPVRYTWPSLVDHADGESLVQPKRPARVRDCPRVAHRFGGPMVIGGGVEPIQNRGARRIL